MNNENHRYTDVICSCTLVGSMLTSQIHFTYRLQIYYEHTLRLICCPKAAVSFKDILDIFSSVILVKSVELPVSTYGNKIDWNPPQVTCLCLAGMFSILLGQYYFVYSFFSLVHCMIFISFFYCCVSSTQVGCLLAQIYHCVC